MTTANQILAAARKKWGKTAWVRENKRALSPAARAASIQEVQTINEQIAENEQQQKLVTFKQQQKLVTFKWRELLAAAEFFIAVNGNEPSATEFKATVAAGRKLADLQDEMSALKSERSDKSSGLHSLRYEAGCYTTFPGLGTISENHCQSDTLSDLLAKVRKEYVCK